MPTFPQTIAELREAVEPTSPIVVNGGDKIYPVDVSLFFDVATQIAHIFIRFITYSYLT